MIRKAKLKDVKEIQQLIRTYSSKGDILPRSLGDIYDNLRDFFVCIQGHEIQGMCALHVSWDDLAEVRSLVVHEEARNRGIGVKLVKACLKEARELGVNCVFALTYKPEFFERLGFKKIDKALLPHKIWADCLKCVKFPDCDEEAMMKELRR